jgi:hypothetical protein
MPWQRRSMPPHAKSLILLLQQCALLVASEGKPIGYVATRDLALAQ